MSPEAFAPSDIEKMRAFLAQHDAANPQRIKEFDLNNPPVPPYRHQEYPRMMYNHARNLAQIAHSDAEVAKLEKKGFDKKPATAAAPAEAAE